jgi:hypothetical protein
LRLLSPSFPDYRKVVCIIGSLFVGFSRGAQLLTYPWLKNGPPLSEMVVLFDWASQITESTLAINGVTDVTARSPSHPVCIIELSAENSGKYKEHNHIISILRDTYCKHFELCLSLHHI